MRTPPLPIGQLIHAAETEIARVLGVCAGPPRLGEVDTVAQVVVNAPPGIAAAWRPLLAAHGCSFNVTSVFCHASPQVSFAHPDAPVELADLLLVMDYHYGGTHARQAALVQAKLDHGGSVTIRGGKPAAQLHLMQKWPSFTFVPRAYDRRSRDFQSELAPSADACGRYGCIDLVGVPPFWGQLAPAGPVPFRTAHGISLGRFLAELADGAPSAGAPAVWYAGAPPASAPDWSFTVAELLDVTAMLAHRAMARAGSAGGVRGVDAMTLRAPVPAGAFFLAHAPGDDGFPPRISGPFEGDGEGQGISFIHGVIERG